MKVVKILSSLIVLILCSCGAYDTSALKPAEAKQLKATTIEVVNVGSSNSSAGFSVIGTTAFNNKFENIAGYPSYAEHLVERLRSKGYTAKVVDKKSNNPQLRFSDIYPYQAPSLAGLGVHQRKLLGMKGPLMVHSNFRGSLHFDSNGIERSISQPINFGDKGYFNSSSGVTRNISS